MSHALFYSFMHKVKNSQSYFKNDDIQRETSDVSRPFWRPVYRFVCHNSGALQTLLFKFSFFSRTSIKIHRIASNNFTMHLIISKLLRRQKCRQRRKTIRLKDVENVSQRNLRTGGAKEYIFRASGLTDFENSPCRR